MFRMNGVSCWCFSSVTILLIFIKIKTFYFQPLMFAMDARTALIAVTISQLEKRFFTVK